MRKPLGTFILALAMTVLPGTVFAALPPADALVKGSGPAVYYKASDGRRYVFPNAATYASWFTSFKPVIQVRDDELATLPIGGNVTYRPGIRMIKIQTDSKIYAVAPGGILRWVTSEAIAEALYGQYWNKAIDDVSDAFFVNYRVGNPIRDAAEFSPVQAAANTETIEIDKGLSTAQNPLRSDTVVGNVVDSWRAFALKDINRLRQENGKPLIMMNAELNDIALIHSKDMAFYTKNLQHEGSLGEEPDDRIRYGKVPDLVSHTFTTVPHPAPIDWSGENVGMVYGYPETVEQNIQRLHNAFMDEPVDQPNHRTTMLSTLHPYSQVGIGPYLDSDGTFWLTADYISVP